MSLKTNLLSLAERFNRFIIDKDHNNKSSIRPGRVLLLALGFNAALFTLFLFFITPFYETGDEAAMMRIASGITTGEPSEYLVFSNVLYGFILKCLYSFNNTINWYSIGLLLVHYLGMSALLSAFLYRRPQASTMLAFLVYFVAFEFRVLMNMQFTSTAIVGGFSACLLMLFASQEGSKDSLKVGVFAMLVAVLAFWVRYKAGLLAFGLCLPLVGIQSLRLKSWKTAIAFSTTLMIFALSMAFHESYTHRTEEWSTFLKYNNVRGQLHDDPRFRLYRIQEEGMFDELEKNGWSKNDHSMYVNWFYTDLDTYSFDNLKTMYTTFAHITNTPEQSVDLFVTRFKSQQLIVYLAFGMLFLAVLVNPSQWMRTLSLSLGILAWMVLLCVYLVWKERLPDRLLIPMISGVGALFWVQSGSEQSSSPKEASRKSRALKGLVALALIGAMSVQVFNLNKINRLNMRHKHYYDKMIASMAQDFNQTSEEPVFIAWGWFFPHEWDNALSNFRDYAELNTINLRWHQHSPLWASALVGDGLEQPITDLYTRDNVYLISGYYPDLAIQYVQEHYGIELEAKVMKSYAHPEYEIPDGHQKTMIFKLILKDAPTISID